MKNKGVSLIVLIITIVVIIILAAAVILAISNNNPIGNSRVASVTQTRDSLQSGILVYTGNVASKTLGDYTSSQILLGSTTNTGTYKLITDNTNDEKEITKDGKQVKLYKLNYEKVKNSLNLEVKDNGTGSWYIDGYGIVYLVYTTIENVPTYYKDDNGIISSLSNFVVVLGENGQEESNVAVVGTIVTGSNKTIDGEDPAYNNPIVPVGFKPVNTTDATWGAEGAWNNGLVVEDANGNQFVWIPVDSSTYTNSITELRNSDSTGDNWITTSALTEDDADALPTGVTSIQTQVDSYGGFYVARYEASLPDSQITNMSTKTFSADDNNKNDIGTPQSKSGGIVWNRINYNNSRDVSKLFISSSSSNYAYVRSGLITGTYWDIMLQFIAQTGVNLHDSTAWGNYKNKIGYTITGYYRIQDADVPYTYGTYEKTEESLLLLQTGKFGEVTGNHPKNLYDVAGNVWEWTAEKVITNCGITYVGNRVLRGAGYDNYGYYNNSYCRNGLNNATTDGIQPHVGFRFVLYVL